MRWPRRRAARTGWRSGWPSRGPRARPARADQCVSLPGGRGSAPLGGQAPPVRRGVAAYLPPGTAWSVEVADGEELRALSVVVCEPPAGGSEPTVVDLEAEDTHGATA